jgi:hypothetical protein
MTREQLLEGLGAALYDYLVYPPNDASPASQAVLDYISPMLESVETAIAYALSEDYSVNGYTVCERLEKALAQLEAFRKEAV